MTSNEVIIGTCLIGRHLCVSWDRVKSLFAQTLESVFAQTSSNFQMVVACNDVPEGAPFEDRRINYLVLPRVEKEELKAQPFKDIAKKEYALRQWAAHSTGRYFYALDADDLISCRLIEYLNNAPPRAGYILETGYALDGSSGKLASLPTATDPSSTFNRWCGSSVVVSMNPLIRPAARQAQLNAIWAGGHRRVRDHFRAVLGDDPADVPFRAGIYRLYNGENFSQREVRPWGEWNRTLNKWMFDNAIEPDGALRAEFGLP